ncbi:MAG: S9 family peptidase, partial [Sphingomonas sp.]|nr:S9 family peptidase [Sphingomonas sp.]
DKIDVNWWRWVGTGWLAVGVGAQDKFEGYDIYVTRLIGVNAALTKANRIDWEHSGIRADDVLWSARDGSPRVLLSRQTGVQSIDQVYPEVVEADLSTGKTRRVVNGSTSVFDWYADGSGRVRMGYRYDDDRRRGQLLYRGADETLFRTIAVQRRDDEHNIPLPQIFTPDGNAIAIDDSDGYDAVYEVSLPDLKLGRKLYATPGYDVGGVVSNHEHDGLAGVTLTDKYSRTAWLDPALKEFQDVADKAVGTRRAQIISWNADRTRFLIDIGSPSEAGMLYFWDTNADRMKRLAWNSQTLQGRLLSPVKTVRYAARDGTQIEALLTMPRHRLAARNLPAVIMPHGGPLARDSEGWDWWAQYLAEIGYVVIQPNYRGSAGYGTAFARMGRGEWGLKMQDDLNDALAWAAKEGIVDPKRVCMIGASYGGYAAMRAAQRDGALYRCAVSYAGVSDLAGMRSYDAQFLNGRALGDYWRARTPDFKAVSPRFGAEQFSVPILIVHGKADMRVPVKQSRQMADALKQAGKPYEYVEQPLGDHHFSRAADRLDFLKRMKAFLDRHNPA